jgi:hypothetical protein
MSHFYTKYRENKALMAFAFTLEPSFHHDQKEYTRLSWSPAVKSILETMLNTARENSENKYLQLPYSALRFDIEATASGLLSVVNDIGLKYFSHEPKPFLVADNNSITQQVNDSFDIWTTSEGLAKFCTKYEVDLQSLARLDKLYTQGKVLSPSREIVNPFDWQQGYKNSHNNEELERLFGDLSSALLKALSGIVIHPKLGKLLPVISRYRNNAVALMTKPLMMEKGEFSLHLKLSVETLPGYDKPIIIATFTKTRWLDDKMKFIDEPENWYKKNITGYVHDWGNSGRCIAFELVKNGDSGEYEFRDDVYSRMSERCNLPTDGTVNDLKTCRLKSDSAVARAIYTNQMPNNHPLQHGFTTADRVILFDAIVEQLSKIGIVPWTDWTEIRAKKVKKPTRSMVDLQAFLEGLTEDSEEVEEDKITPEMLKEKLKQALSFEVEEISDKLKGGNQKVHKLEDVREINMGAIIHVFDILTPTLVVIGENPKRRKIIMEMAKLLFGECVKVYQVNLPNNAYGIKPKTVKQKEHLKAQLEIWSDTIRQIKNACPMPIFALVEAPKYFPSADGKTSQKDYPLNKVATKKALANESIAAQYLLPPETTKAGKIKLDSYLMRIQNALYDLLFAQSGYAEAVSESVNALFTEERKPRYVIGLSVIAKNKTLFASRRKLIAAIRYDAYTGDSSIKYSYWEEKSSKISDWLPFTEGLFNISRLSEHTLGSKAQDIGNSIVAFCHNVIAETAKDDPNAIILVNPTHINSRYAWNWLQDKNMLKDISIGRKRFKKSAWKGIRIIRCRTDTPPGICQRKEVVYQEIDTAGNENADNSETIPVPTNVGTLLKVKNTQPPTFLSVASPAKTVQYKRGSSVFEKRKLAFPVSDKWPGKAYLDIAPKVKGKTVHILSETDIMAKPASAPKTVEFAIVHKHPDDSDETLVRFVESLRFGYAQYQEWTALPFVLHAMHTVEEYVSTFELEDNEQFI